MLNNSAAKVLKQNSLFKCFFSAYLITLATGVEKEWHGKDGISPQTYYGMIAKWKYIIGNFIFLFSYTLKLRVK